MKKSSADPARAPLRTTFVNMNENNPHGMGTVGGIDLPSSSSIRRT